MNTKVICLANNKGGSGKSTTCANVGYGLASMGKRVLLIDGDMQMNLSLAFLPEERVMEFAKNGQNLYCAVRDQQDLTPYIHPTEFGVDLIASSPLMSGIEYELFTKWQREFIFTKCLKSIREAGTYDFILLDAPPTLGEWVMNLLCASDDLMIPVEASPWGLFGLANMFDFFATVQQINPAVQLGGIVVTKVDERKNYFRQTMDALREMNVPLFETVIHVDSNIEWAQDISKPVAAYRRSCRSAKEYDALAKEVASLVNR